MNEVKIYENVEFGQVRTQLDEDGLVWFCAADVCKTLGYANARDAVSKHVEIEDVAKRDTPTSSGVQNMLYVNESGIFALIMSSKLPKAKEFKHWVTSEVLPSLRQTGSYQMSTSMLQPTLSPLQLRALADHIEGLETRNEALEKKNVALSRQVEDDKPLVLFAKTVTTSPDDILIGELAKILRQSGIDIGEKRLFTWMRENGYLCKHGDYYNLPTQRAMEMGLFKIKKSSICLPTGETKVRSTTKVTGKGQIYFANRFLNHSTIQ